MPVRMKRVPKCLLRSNYGPQIPRRRLWLGFLVCYGPLARWPARVDLEAKRGISRTARSRVAFVRSVSSPRAEITAECEREPQSKRAPLQTPQPPAAVLR